MWVGTENWQQWVNIEYEGKVNYCLRCKKQGHSVDQCRREIARKQQVNFSGTLFQHKSEPRGNRGQTAQKQGTNQIQHKARVTSSRHSVLENPAGPAMEEEGQTECSQQEVPWTVVQRRHNKVWEKHKSERKQKQRYSNQAWAAMTLPGESGERCAKNMPRQMRKLSAETTKKSATQGVVGMGSPAQPRFSTSEESGELQAALKISSHDASGKASPILASKDDQSIQALGVQASSTDGHDAALPERSSSNRADVHLVGQDVPERHNILQANESSESGSIQRAIESAFMKRIRSCMEDFMFQMQGQSSNAGIHPTTYKRMLSVDDSELYSPFELAFPREEYQDIPLSVVPSYQEDLEEANKDISDHITSLQKARDSTRRVTRSATKYTPRSINDD